MNIVPLALRTQNDGSENRPYSKMAATDLNELKLNWMKN